MSFLFGRLWPQIIYYLLGYRPFSRYYLTYESSPCPIHLFPHSFLLTISVLPCTVLVQLRRREGLSDARNPALLKLRQKIPLHTKTNRKLQDGENRNDCGTYVFVLVTSKKKKTRQRNTHNVQPKQQRTQMNTSRKKRGQTRTKTRTPNKNEKLQTHTAQRQKHKTLAKNKTKQ